MIGAIGACVPGSSPPLQTSTVSGSTETRTDLPSLETFALEPLPLDERWIIAVPNFSVRSSNLRLSGDTLDDRSEAFFVELGSGVADIFVNEAFRSGQFRITERAELDTVLSEQNLAQSGRVDPQTAAQVGQVTGAELIVLGSVAEFGVNSTGGGGRLFGILGGSAETVTARVTVDIRFVDAVSAEIIGIGTSTAEVSQTSVEIDVLNVIRGLQGGRTGTTIVDLAVRNAIIGAVNDAAVSLPAKDATSTP
ncbi:MAG: CsgG/HfaB family protein [Trueperaceae bacterium]|nr:CsgG/HfaB family protein [Trueperaceae bacterium]